MKGFLKFCGLITILAGGAYFLIQAIDKLYEVNVLKNTDEYDEDED